MRRSLEDNKNTQKPGDNIQIISIKDGQEDPALGHTSGILVSRIPISGDNKETERNMKKNQQLVSNLFNPLLNTLTGSLVPQDDLDQVKFKIVEILSLKDNYSKENQSLKSHQAAYLDLLQKNEELRKQLGQLEEEGGVEVPDLILRSRRKSPRSSPDGQERQEHQSSCQVISYSGSGSP